MQIHQIRLMAEILRDNDVSEQTVKNVLTKFECVEAEIRAMDKVSLALQPTEENCHAEFPRKTRRRKGIPQHGWILSP